MLNTYVFILFLNLLVTIQGLKRFIRAVTLFTGRNFFKFLLQTLNAKQNTESFAKLILNFFI